MGKEEHEKWIRYFKMLTHIHMLDCAYSAYFQPSYHLPPMWFLFFSWFKEWTFFPISLVLRLTIKEGYSKKLWHGDDTVIIVTTSVAKWAEKLFYNKISKNSLRKCKSER